MSIQLNIKIPSEEAKTRLVDELNRLPGTSNYERLMSAITASKNAAYLKQNADDNYKSNEALREKVRSLIKENERLKENASTYTFNVANPGFYDVEPEKEEVSEGTTDENEGTIEVEKPHDTLPEWWHKATLISGIIVFVVALMFFVFRGESNKSTEVQETNKVTVEQNIDSLSLSTIDNLRKLNNLTE